MSHLDSCWFSLGSKHELKTALRLLLDSTAPSGDKTWYYLLLKWGAASLTSFVITSGLERRQLTQALEHLSFKHLQMKKGGCCFSDCCCHTSLHLENRHSETVTLLSKKGVKQGYVSLPPSFPFPVALVAAFSQCVIHCSMDHDCLLFSKIAPESKVTEAISWEPSLQPAVEWLPIQQEACRMCKSPASHFPVSSQAFCLLGDIQKNTDCVSVHMQQCQRLHTHRLASVRKHLLFCSSLPQTVASLVRALLESSLVSPHGETLSSASTTV